MTAHLLGTLALGLAGLAACADPPGKGDDDDTTAGDSDTTGDDDDDDATGLIGVPATHYYIDSFDQLTVWAQFTVEGGEVVPFVTDGAYTYRSVLVVELGPYDWDPNNPSDSNFCSVVADLGTNVQGLLDGLAVVAPSVDVGITPLVETDCYNYFTMPVGYDPSLLVSAYPGWAFGIPSALTPGMLDGLAGIDPEYQDLFLGAHWNIPILDPPAWESVYGVGYAVAGGAVGAPLARTEVAAQAVLPDGAYYSDALLILSLEPP